MNFGLLDGEKDDEHNAVGFGDIFKIFVMQVAFSFGTTWIGEVYLMNYERVTDTRRKDRRGCTSPIVIDWLIDWVWLNVYETF